MAQILDRQSSPGLTTLQYLVAIPRLNQYHPSNQVVAPMVEQEHRGHGTQAALTLRTRPTIQALPTTLAPPPEGIRVEAGLTGVVEGAPTSG